MSPLLNSPEEKEILVKVTTCYIYDEVYAVVYPGDTEDDVRRRIIQDVSCGDTTLRGLLDAWVEDVELPADALVFPPAEEVA